MSESASPAALGSEHGDDLVLAVALTFELRAFSLGRFGLGSAGQGKGGSQWLG